MIYPWRRFWCRAGTSINMSDDGFLADPESKYGQYYQPSVIPPAELDSAPCLILLGEPGIGKSVELKNLYERARTASAQPAKFVDLAAWGEAGLLKVVFEDPLVNDLKAGAQLDLFVDGLDESPIQNIGSLLPQLLGALPSSRLRLRLACRTARWSPVFTERFAKLWGDQIVLAAELTPLRKVDVEIAATASSIDPAAFLREVMHRDVTPLANRPITLQFLIQQYAQSAGFPATLADLYQDGCRMLCEDSQSRTANKYPRQLNPAQRMAVAARIAATAFVCNRNALWMGAYADAPEGDLRVDEIAGGHEIAANQSIPVTERDVQESLDSGLFVLYGEHRMGWAHRSFGEFLAAHYLNTRLDHRQIIGLIVHEDGKLVPQLHGIAAWLANMNPEMLQLIIHIEPEVILGADLTNVDPAVRASLTEALLDKFAQRQLPLYADAIDHNLHRLNYPQIGEQLKRYICDKSAPFEARLKAIRIAVECQVVSLQQKMADITLDPAEECELRISAALHCVNVADDSTKARLVPLATGTAGDDPDDELKGLGLEAVWPKHLSAAEMFNCITPPKRPSLIGTYSGFVYNSLAAGLAPADYPVALAWVTNHPNDSAPSSAQHAVDRIMLESWDHLGTLGCYDLYAQAVISRLRGNYQGMQHDYQEEYSSRLSSDPDVRLRIVREMIRILANSPEDSDVLFSSTVMPNQEPWLTRDDFDWLLEQLEASGLEAERRIISDLIWGTVNRDDTEQVSRVIETCGHIPELAHKFRYFVTVVPLDSDMAKEMRESHERELRWARDHERQMKEIERRRQVPSVEEVLARIEAGNPMWWAALWEIITHDQDKSLRFESPERDLTSFPTWKALRPELQQRVVEAAEGFVRALNPAPDKWLGRHSWPTLVLAAYAALHLLRTQKPTVLNAFNQADWQKWAPVIVACPMIIRGKDTDAYCELIKLAWAHVETEMAQTALTLFDAEFTRDTPVIEFERLDACWGPVVEAGLIVRAQNPSAQPKAVGAALRMLLQHEVAEGRAIAEGLLSLSLPPDGLARERSVEAGLALIEEAEDSGWPILWGVLNTDIEFGKTLIQRSTRTLLDFPNLHTKLTESQIADLYIWMVRNFPYDADVRYEGPYSPTPRDHVAKWRDALLAFLKNRGTHQAAEAVEQIHQQLPNVIWLNYVAAEARSRTRSATWLPLTPQDFARLVADHSRRVVQSGDQLLDVIIESLERLEKELQGETPAVADLWNVRAERDGAVCWPKDENHFSDYVKRHLERDLTRRGVVVAREVEISRPRPATEGQRTDIHVNAVALDASNNPNQKLTVIIEVKGCWNQELLMALKNQLVDRYLHDNGCAYGLYLVGWFQCDSWNADVDQPRRKRTPNLSIDEVRTKLVHQAAEASIGPYQVRSMVLNTSLR